MDRAAQDGGTRSLSMALPAPVTSARPPMGLLVLLASLYCAQGLPSGLIAHALPVMLRQHGVDLTWISLLKLLALPWLLKALWAPWVDRFGSRRLGHHRGWILPLQGSVIGMIAVLAFMSPEALFGSHLAWLLGLLLLVNLAAATQDIATDGLTVRLLSDRWRGLGNSLQVGGYKIGMLASGAGLLMLSGSLGWHGAMGLLVVLLVLTLIPIWRFPEQRVLPPRSGAPEPAGPGLLWRHYRGFIARPGMGAWLWVVLAFKLGDALGSPMVRPMLVDQGWTTAGLGRLTLISTLVGIGGALLGGLLYARLGGLRALLAFGLLQAVGIGAMALLIDSGARHEWVWAVVLFEQAADGMSSVALFAAMMRQCRPAHEGADYTLQASAQVLLGSVVGGASGALAKVFGYDGLFLTAGVLGVLALGLVLHAWRRLPADPQATAAPA